MNNEKENHFTGRVHVIGDIQQFASGFTKREIVLCDGHETYPQYIPFELLKEKANIIESLGIQPGDVVTVKYNLRGREWQGRYFPSLNAWFISKEKPAAQTAQAARAAIEQGYLGGIIAQQAKQYGEVSLQAKDDNDGDDVPF